MSAGVGYGLGGYLLGTGFDLYGQYQGEKAMRAEADAAAQRQKMYSDQEAQILQQQIDRQAANPLGARMAAGTTAALAPQLNAVHQASSAAGHALGVSPGNTALAASGLNAPLAAGAEATATGARGRQDWQSMAGAQQQRGLIEAQRGMDASLDPQRMDLSSRKGEMFRQIGGLTSSLGKGLAMYSLANPGVGAAKTVAPTGPQGPAGGPEAFMYTDAAAHGAYAPSFLR